MREPGLQGDGKNEATVTSTLTLMPSVIANKQRAPVAILSPTKRTAVIECLNNNGLHKRRGYWWGTPEGKHISGVTVARHILCNHKSPTWFGTTDRTRPMVCTDADRSRKRRTSAKIVAAFGVITFRRGRVGAASKTARIARRCWPRAAPKRAPALPSRPIHSRRYVSCWLTSAVGPSTSDSWPRAMRPRVRIFDASLGA
jgi:hypothetical protein